MSAVVQCQGMILRFHGIQVEAHTITTTQNSLAIITAHSTETTFMEVAERLSNHENFFAKSLPMAYLQKILPHRILCNSDYPKSSKFTHIGYFEVRDVSILYAD